MAVTVDDLVRSGPAVALITGSGAVSVTWVHSSDLADPAPFLDAGHLLLTTGQQLEDGIDVERYVDGLVAVGVSALGFGIGVVVETVPPALVRACEAAGLALLEVPYATPFIAVARWVAEALAVEANARDAWTLRAQRAVSLAALSAGRTVAVLDELARQLPAEVVLWDARAELVSRHGSPRSRAMLGSGVGGPVAEEVIRGEVARMVRRGLRAGSAVEHDGVRTVLQTLGRRDELRGVLSVTVAGRLDPAATAVLTSATALTEFALDDVGRRRTGERAVRGQLLALLLAGRRDVVDQVIGSAHLPTAPLRVVVADETAAAAVDLAGRLEALVGAGTVVFDAPHQNRWVVVIADDDLSAVLSIADGGPLSLGVSRRTDYPHLSSALLQATGALAQAGAQTSTVFADVAGDPVLGILPRAELAALARVRLAAVEADPEGVDLLRTLEVWLRHNALWEPAARELGLHRHTVKAKIRRVEHLTGVDLDAFAAKAQLWMMLMAL